ncbi:MAG: hypothetical protein J6N93_05260 [Clostridia bacterium]|nr:hypothetical protein [Clostridia bacterium]
MIAKGIKKREIFDIKSMPFEVIKIVKIKEIILIILTFSVRRKTSQNKLSSADSIHAEITILKSETSFKNITLKLLFSLKLATTKIPITNISRVSNKVENDKSPQKKESISLPLINPAPIILPIINDTDEVIVKRAFDILKYMTKAQL